MSAFLEQVDDDLLPLRMLEQFIISMFAFSGKILLGVSKLYKRITEANYLKTFVLQKLLYQKLTI